MRLEKEVKQAIKQFFDERGIFYFMPVHNGLGKMTTDFIVCVNGHFLAIETKIGKNVPTNRQLLFLKSVVAAGGSAYVVNEQNLQDFLNLPIFTSVSL